MAGLPSRQQLPTMSSEHLVPVSSENSRHVGNCSFSFHAEGEDLALYKPSLVLKEELVILKRGSWRQLWIVQWSQRKVVDPFFMILRRGLQPKLLSLSASLGLVLGVFPVCGVPLFLCAIAALVLRSNCHVPTLMLANFVASFFELGLVVPYMRVGESVTGGEQFSLSSIELWEALLGHDSHALIVGLLHAIIGWSICVPVSVAVLYISFLPVFGYLVAKFGMTKVPYHHSISAEDDYVRLDGGSSSNWAQVIDA